MKPSIIRSILLLLAFVGAAIFRANYEFLFYASTLIMLIVIVALLDLVGEPYNILKYDQFVHLYCYIVMAMLVFEVLQRVVSQSHKWMLFAVTVLAASGIGGLNEVIEFAAVVIVGSTGVGGYTNTALDLVANLLGAIMGAGWMVFRSARFKLD